MYVQVEVERPSEDKLNNQIWRFCLLDEQLVLDSYIVTNRESIRHKPKNVKFYTRIDGRNNTILLNDVPFTDDVTSEALAKVVAKFKVVKTYAR